LSALSNAPACLERRNERGERRKERGGRKDVFQYFYGFEL
jgi:hypothetical protein